MPPEDPSMLCSCSFRALQCLFGLRLETTPNHDIQMKRFHWLKFEFQARDFLHSYSTYNAARWTLSSPLYYVLLIHVAHTCMLLLCPGQCLVPQQWSKRKY